MDNWKKCVEYCVKAVKAGEADPNVVILAKLANKHKLDDKQRAWLCLLYSTCYCASTTWFLFNTLPPLDKLTPFKLDAFWVEVGKSLLFQSDRKYVRNMDWFVPIVQSYRSEMGSDHGAILKLIDSGKYGKVFGLFASLRFCGRFSAFIYIDLLQALFGIEVEINPKNWNDWATAGEGLCHAIGREDWAEEHHKTDKYPKGADIELSSAFDKLKAEICESVPITDSELETALCAYRKLFKQSRYFGYYVDRQQEEFVKNAPVFNKNGQARLMNELWKERGRCLDNSLLGELNGWEGVRKERYKIFVETGGYLE